MTRVLPQIAAIAGRHAARTIFTRFMPPVKPDDVSGQWRVYFEHWREVTRERVDPEMLDLVPELAQLVPPALVFDKPVYSPFAGWRLDTLLKEREVRAVVVTGAETDVCVLATVLGAIDHGYHVFLVSDAVCSSSDEGHDALMTMYRQRFSLQIEVVDTASVLADWPE